MQGVASTPGDPGYPRMAAGKLRVNFASYDIAAAAALGTIAASATSGNPPVTFGGCVALGFLVICRTRNR